MKFGIRALAGILALSLAMPILGGKARGVETSAKSALLLDAATGRVLYEKNADQQCLIASTTKIMTALVVCKECNVLDRVEIPQEAVGIEGSSMYLKAGEVMTVQELLYGLMLHSGNDAAVALAIYCGGTVEGFVELMNDEARRLGLKNTHYENPNGLDGDSHYSTARDLARLTARAMENPVFARTVATKTVKAAGRQLTNHNKLLWQYDGAEGVKTGYTKRAGRILVSSAIRQGRRLIAVTVSDPDDWRDHKRLLDMGFSRYTPRELVKAGQTLCTIPVLSGNGTTVSLVALEDFSWAMGEGEQVTYELGGGEFVFAPVKAGESWGFCHILVEGRAVGRVPVAFGEDVAQAEGKRTPWFDALLNRIK